MHYIGIDVSKKHLDVKSSVESGVIRYANTSHGIKKLMKEKLRVEETTLVVMESTGGYERAVHREITNAKVEVAVVNPEWTHKFLRSTGKREKTDKIDACGLCQYAQIFDDKIRRTPALGIEEEALKLLFVRRSQLIVERTREKNRLQNVPAIVSQSISRNIKSINKELKLLEKQIEEGIEKMPLKQGKIELLTTAKGVGNITAWGLVLLLPELGTLNRKEISKLVGVCPLSKDSGSFTGKRSISGGRQDVRCLLYMAILSAKSHNPVIKKKYTELCKKGMSKKVAMVACMRKLLVRLNAMLAKQEGWSDSPKESDPKVDSAKTNATPDKEIVTNQEKNNFEKNNITDIIDKSSQTYRRSAEKQRRTG